MLGNICFIFSLIFTSNKKIVLGLAPYNYKLYFLEFALSNHVIYYFTSYTCWDQTYMAHDFLYSRFLLKKWKIFLSQKVKHIFAVSNKVKGELVNNNFSEEEKITVVYHSLKKKYIVSDLKRNLNYIYAGRLVPEKGIEELLDCFRENSDINLYIVGKGVLKDMILHYSARYSNIKYCGYIDDKEELYKLYSSCSYFILNSKRTNEWEELFGISIIESMLCGAVPISVSHAGPLEIIKNGVNGFLFNEGEVKSAIYDSIRLDDDNYYNIKKNAIKSAESYYDNNISKKWIAVLE